MKYKKKYDPLSARKADAAPLKDVIDQLLDTFRLRDRFMEQDIVASWEKLMGKTIASRTEKLAIRNKTLYVRLNSASLKQELNMGRSKIIELLNKDAGGIYIVDIIFQ